MFMTFLAKPSHRPWLAILFTSLAVLGTGLALLV